MPARPRGSAAALALGPALALLLGLAATPASAMVDRSILRDVIRASAPRLGRCIEQPLAHGGTITVTFLVAADGRVTEATVTRDEIGRPELATCVLEVVLDLRFPRFDHGDRIQVNYPFRFDP